MTVFLSFMALILTFFMTLLIIIRADKCKNRKKVKDAILDDAVIVITIGRKHDE